MSVASARPPHPGFLAGVLETTDLGWRQMVRSKILIGIGAAILFAAAIAFLIHQYGDNTSAARDFQALQALLLSVVVVPLIALLVGTSAMATEREGGTLAYLFTRPFRRSAVIVGKGLGAIVVALVATVVAVLAVWVASGAPDAQLGGGIVALLLEATALTAIFVLLGTVFARSLYIALAYVALVEGLLGNSVAARSGATVTYHARNLLSEWSGTHLPIGIFPELPETAAASAFTLLAVAVVALAGAAAWVETREYGLKDRPKEE